MSKSSTSNRKGYARSNKNESILVGGKKSENCFLVNI